MSLNAPSILFFDPPWRLRLIHFIQIHNSVMLFPNARLCESPLCWQDHPAPFWDVGTMLSAFPYDFYRSSFEEHYKTSEVRGERL